MIDLSKINGLDISDIKYFLYDDTIKIFYSNLDNTKNFTLTTTGISSIIINKDVSDTAMFFVVDTVLSEVKDMFLLQIVGDLNVSLLCKEVRLCKNN